MKARLGVHNWSLLASQILQSVNESRRWRWGAVGMLGALMRVEQVVIPDGSTHTIKDTEMCKALDMKAGQQSTVARREGFAEVT